jgi:hypothetical protein
MGDKSAGENSVNTICKTCGATIQAEGRFCSKCGSHIKKDTRDDTTGALAIEGVKLRPEAENPPAVELDRARLSPEDEDSFRKMFADAREPREYEVDIDRVRLRPGAADAHAKAKHGHSPSERLISGAIKWEYAYGMLGLILGLSSIIGGVILGLRGVTGSTSWTAKVLGLQSSVNDAAPGVILFIVGLFWVWITKPKVRLKDVQDMKETRDRD